MGRSERHARRRRAERAREDPQRARVPVDVQRHVHAPAREVEPGLLAGDEGEVDAPAAPRPAPPQRHPARSDAPPRRSPRGSGAARPSARAGATRAPSCHRRYDSAPGSSSGGPGFHAPREHRPAREIAAGHGEGEEERGGADLHGRPPPRTFCCVAGAATRARGVRRGGGGAALRHPGERLPGCDAQPAKKDGARRSGRSAPARLERSRALARHHTDASCSPWWTRSSRTCSRRRSAR